MWQINYLSFRGCEMTVCSLPSVHWRDEEELRDAVKIWVTKMGVQVPQIHIR